MIFTNLTFRALGRTHIASKPCVAIAMLCFDSTVGFPWSVPVLTQQFDVESRSHTSPRTETREGPTRGSCGGPASAGTPGRTPRPAHATTPSQAAKPRRRSDEAEHGAEAPSTPAFGPGPLGISPTLPRRGLLPDQAPHTRRETRPRHPPRPLFAEAGHQTPAGAVLTLLSEPLLLPKLRS